MKTKKTNNTKNTNNFNNNSNKVEKLRNILTELLSKPENRDDYKLVVGEGDKDSFYTAYKTYNEIVIEKHPQMKANSGLGYYPVESVIQILLQSPTMTLQSERFTLTENLNTEIVQDILNSCEKCIAVREEFIKKANEKKMFTEKRDADGLLETTILYELNVTHYQDDSDVHTYTMYTSEKPRKVSGSLDFYLNGKKDYRQVEDVDGELYLIEGKSCNRIKLQGDDYISSGCVRIDHRHEWDFTKPIPKRDCPNCQYRAECEQQYKLDINSKIFKWFFLVWVDLDEEETCHRMYSTKVVHIWDDIKKQEEHTEPDVTKANFKVVDTVGEVVILKDTHRQTTYKYWVNVLGNFFAPVERYNTTVEEIKQAVEERYKGEKDLKYFYFLRLL